MHCIVEAGESTRVWKELFTKVMRIIYSLNHYNLVHKFNPLCQAMKTPDAYAGRGIKSLNHCNLLHKFYHAKAAVEKVWENLKRYWHGS